jgi:uncharacterized protein
MSGVTLGVSDLNRAKQFYRDGPGWPVQVDQDHFVSFRPADGSSSLALYPREVLAGDAGVSPDGGGFRGITFSYIVRSEDRVDGPGHPDEQPRSSPDGQGVSDPTALAPRSGPPDG